MFAIVEIGGQQFNVRPNEQYQVPLLSVNAGEKVEFSNILLGFDGTETKIGTPYVPGKVNAKILHNGKGTKVLVFHKKRRKGYRKLNGHRQHFTSIEITDIQF